MCGWILPGLPPGATGIPVLRSQTAMVSRWFADANGFNACGGQSCLPNGIPSHRQLIAPDLLHHAPPFPAEVNLPMLTLERRLQPRPNKLKTMARATCGALVQGKDEFPCCHQSKSPHREETSSVASAHSSALHPRLYEHWKILVTGCRGRMGQAVIRATDAGTGHETGRCD